MFSRNYTITPKREDFKPKFSVNSSIQCENPTTMKSYTSRKLTETKNDDHQFVPHKQSQKDKIGKINTAKDANNSEIYILHDMMINEEPEKLFTENGKLNDDASLDEPDISLDTQEIFSVKNSKNIDARSSDQITETCGEKKYPRQYQKGNQVNCALTTNVFGQYCSHTIKFPGVIRKTVKNDRILVDLTMRSDVFNRPPILSPFMRCDERCLCEHKEVSTEEQTLHENDKENRNDKVFPSPAPLAREYLKNIQEISTDERKIYERNKENRSKIFPLIAPSTHEYMKNIQEIATDEPNIYENNKENRNFKGFPAAAPPTRDYLMNIQEVSSDEQNNCKNNTENRNLDVYPSPAPLTHEYLMNSQEPFVYKMSSYNNHSNMMSNKVAEISEKPAKLGSSCLKSSNQLREAQITTELGIQTEAKETKDQSTCDHSFLEKKLISDPRKAFDHTKSYYDTSGSIASSSPINYGGGYRWCPCCWRWVSSNNYKASCVPCCYSGNYYGLNKPTLSSKVNKSNNDPYGSVGNKVKMKDAPFENSSNYIDEKRYHSCVQEHKLNLEDDDCTENAVRTRSNTYFNKFSTFTCDQETHISAHSLRTLPNTQDPLKIQIDLVVRGVEENPTLEVASNNTNQTMSGKMYAVGTKSVYRCDCLDASRNLSMNSFAGCTSSQGIHSTNSDPSCTYNASSFYTNNRCRFTSSLESLPDNRINNRIRAKENAMESRLYKEDHHCYRKQSRSRSGLSERQCEQRNRRKDCSRHQKCFNLDYDSRANKRNCHSPGRSKMDYSQRHKRFEESQLNTNFT